MCLLIFAHQIDPKKPLIVAANRDEFHARPTAAANFWPEHPTLLAGRDLEQGGTWMGVTRGGRAAEYRFAAITNYRDPARTAPAPRSRGELPLQYLIGDQGPRDFLSAVAAVADEYAGFNLLLGDGDSLWYFSNSKPPGERSPTLLEPGVYGLSNASLDTPWPKVQRGKNCLKSLLASDSLSHDDLAGVVSDPALAEAAALREQGMGSDMDRLLSAQFIIAGTYGTRSTTTLWRDSSGRGSWRETSFDTMGDSRQVKERDF
jgi:uncharacterized protein with NRDE domain